MGHFWDWMLAQGIDRVMAGQRFGELRRRVLRDLGGTVLEVGLGTGLNLPHYPSRVKTVLAVEPSAPARSLALRKSSPGLPRLEFVGTTAESIPLPDACLDSVVSTWTLCSIPDLSRALAEVRRLLRPGGRLVFLEHGLSDDTRVARWQDRLTPLQKKLAGGCHLNRKMDLLLEEAGFGLEGLKTYYMEGPKPWAFLYEGTAVPKGR